MIIIKIGGAPGINYDLVLDNIAKLIKENKKIIIVHGGKSKLEEIGTKLGNPPKWVTTASGHISRRTSKETIEQFTMVYAGLMNKMIVEKLLQSGIKASGLTGIDGSNIIAKKKNIRIIEAGKKKILRDDYTGKIVEVNTQIIDSLQEKDITPVLCPPAISLENEALNVDGDRMTAMVAEKFKANAVIYLSNIPGLLRDKDDESTLIKSITKENLEASMEFAKGTMKKKVMGAMEAIEAGVEKVIFADARIKEPVTNALLGKGTVIE